jgi:capsular exopolysaccharide synthesis family protein
VVQAFIAQEQELLANPYVVDRSGLSVVEPAVPPARPQGSGPLRSALIGAVAGVMLALGAVLLIGYLDTAVRSRQDLAALTGSPALAEIAKLKGSGPQAMLVTVHRPDSAPAEAYRMIRARVEFAAAQRPLRSLLVTSARPGEGKSVTAANLAVALAQTGMRVILIDANLRRPTLHAIFKRPNTRGLTTALQQLGHGRASDHLLPTVEERLSLLPSGPASANPASLLAPQRISQLADELAEHADLLVFDSPQCLDTIDASLLLRACDAALLVVQAGVTKAEALLQAHQLLQASQAQLLGAVLNHGGGARAGRGGFEFAPGAQRAAGPERAEEEAPLEGRALPGQAREVGGSK